MFDIALFFLYLELYCLVTHVADERHVLEIVISNIVHVQKAYMKPNVGSRVDRGVSITHAQK